MSLNPPLLEQYRVSLINLLCVPRTWPFFLISHVCSMLKKYWQNAIRDN